jgi:hypothetical protein
MSFSGNKELDKKIKEICALVVAFKEMITLLQGEIRYMHEIIRYKSKINSGE